MQCYSKKDHDEAVRKSNEAYEKLLRKEYPSAFITKKDEAFYELSFAITVIKIKEL